jgi:predicted nucleic acid-binding protein
MPIAFLIDTDVLIDYLRDETVAVSYLESLPPPLLISAISVAELYAGVREGTERLALDEFLDAFEIVPIDEEIAVAGGLYRRGYGKSHGTGLNDALIAATTTLRNATLVTLNNKHFPMPLSLTVPYQKA